MSNVHGLKKVFCALAATTGLGGCVTVPGPVYRHPGIPAVAAPTVTYVDRGSPDVTAYINTTPAPVYYDSYNVYAPYSLRSEWNLWTRPYNFYGHDRYRYDAPYRYDHRRDNRHDDRHDNRRHDYGRRW
jgi:hypothetical protein